MVVTSPRSDQVRPPRVGGTTVVAGVAGSPVRHSLSPAIHNAWLQWLRIDGVYIPLPTPVDGFARLVDGLRGGVMRGINVTVPFKPQALALADFADDATRASGAANLLLFHADGRVEARNTDGIGLLSALSERAVGWRLGRGPVVILGAGGAARGAAAALRAAGAPELRIVNRTLATAEALAEAVGGRPYPWESLDDAIAGATLVVNATTRGLNGIDPLDIPWPAPPVAAERPHSLWPGPLSGAAALDMVYAPLETAFLKGAAEAGWHAVDGLAMLIGQARPSFEAFYGQAAPEGPNVRAMCLSVLQARA